MTSAGTAFSVARGGVSAGRSGLVGSHLVRGILCLLLAVLGLGLATDTTQGATAARVSFRNDVMAVLSKAGCNSGPCHGNQNGKAGFKLSLRGEDAEFDYHALTRDLFARRIDVAKPEASLILLKATTQLAHEGGLRFRVDSEEFNLFRHWIAGGAKDGQLRIAREANDVVIVVAGGVGRKAAYLPTWRGATRSVTRAIG